MHLSKIYVVNFLVSSLLKNNDIQIVFLISSSTRDYHCYCEDGYTGDHCQTDWDECWSDPCLNGATCIDQVADYNCSCAPGFRGMYYVHTIATNLPATFVMRF